MDPRFRVSLITRTPEPNRVIWCGMHQESQTITLGNSDKLAIVDSCLSLRLQAYTWNLSSLGYCYRIRKSSEHRQMIYLHREVMSSFGDLPKTALVDHINNNRLDNRAANLRLASKSENMCNRGPTSSSKSGYKGVYEHKPSRKWRAYIKKDYKQVYLGVFNTKEEAAIAYNRAALELHGKFAFLNPV